MQNFFVKLVPHRNNFIHSMTDREEAIIKDHFRYLTKAQESGVVLFAGPCVDGSFGIVLLKAQDIHAAESFMKADPAISSKIFQFELKQIQISVGSL